MVRLSLSVRCGQRHTRRREVELVSIACSVLKIRRRRVHVPRAILAKTTTMESENGTPISVLNLTKPSLRSGFRRLTLLRWADGELQRLDKNKVLIGLSESA